MNPVSSPGHRPRLVGWILVVGAAMVVVAGVAWLRGGLLGLPAPPPGIDAEQSGLANLAALRERADQLEVVARGEARAADPVLARAAAGLAQVRGAEPQQGLTLLGEAYASAPRDLVVGNAFRMAAMELKRRWIADASRGDTETRRIPPWLAREPLATLARLRDARPDREVELQYALAWADEIVVFHALEIQAPANVESVKILSELLAREPGYVPALFGRGLGYLHRPVRLVWPEAEKAAPDAASHDLGLAVAIGARVGGATPRLRATLALTLGDAYAREGRANRARSWWQIAENASSDTSMRASVQRRFAWQDGEMLDRLASELEARLLDRGAPLTDLAVMWR